MRLSSVISPSFRGTLKSQRMRIFLPLRLMSSMVFLFSDSMRSCQFSVGSFEFIVAKFGGADGRNRTDNLFITSELLCH